MAKKLLFISIISFLAFAFPIKSSANTSIEIIETELQEVSISVKSSTLHVTGANGQILYIYNVAGMRIKSIKIEGQDCRYDLNLPKGCYIVKVGKTVRKISIK